MYMIPAAMVTSENGDGFIYIDEFIMLWSFGIYLSLTLRFPWCLRKTQSNKYLRGAHILAKGDEFVEDPNTFAAKDMNLFVVRTSRP
ncbi:hypothetical protein C5167_001353 [Papaver somniferum]|uniref:Uncharacterized protein n=1 Tax=Papaver somniferum TaxID=3469 RepID=A0A4Y7KW04_PAPSO|nr:hypothetical protein C5167_001353 [Papaver somniferum]